LKIAESEDCDIEVIKAASLFYDIARSKVKNNTEFCHAKEGTKMA
jgi:HD superfamily phosphodiesterase